MRSPTELTALFRERGLKVTPQRQAIFRILHGSAAHPTAESVHAAAIAEMPTVSLRTVYQTLHDLTHMGELVALDVGTGAVRFDPNLDAHHHLVCDVCGLVIDVYADASAVQVADADRQGFEVAATEVVFRGTCSSCHRRSRPELLPATERNPQPHG
jgi:Fe2+ or Zn2+ uptake regulation protein